MDVHPTKNVSIGIDPYPGVLKGGKPVECGTPRSSKSLGSEKRSKTPRGGVHWTTMVDGHQPWRWRQWGYSRSQTHHVIPKSSGLVIDIAILGSPTFEKPVWCNLDAQILGKSTLQKWLALDNQAISSDVPPWKGSNQAKCRVSKSHRGRVANVSSLAPNCDPTNCSLPSGITQTILVMSKCGKPPFGIFFGSKPEVSNRKQLDRKL